MPSSGRIRLKAIKKALDVCLPGCTWTLKKHRYHVRPARGGSTFYFPKGEHGRGERAEIERGHVRKMARQFGVLDCMERELPGLA